MGKLTPEEMQARLDCATRFFVGQNVFRSSVFVELRGVGVWAVTDGTCVLNSEGSWEYEPLPSNRTEEFIARTRFGLDEAFERGRAALKEAVG